MLHPGAAGMVLWLWENLVLLILALNKGSPSSDFGNHFPFTEILTVASFFFIIRFDQHFIERVPRLNNNLNQSCTASPSFVEDTHHFYSIHYSSSLAWIDITCSQICANEHAGGRNCAEQTAASLPTTGTSEATTRTWLWLSFFWQCENLHFSYPSKSSLAGVFWNYFSSHLDNSICLPI